LEVIGVRRSMIVGLFILLVLGLATPAWAQAPQTTEAFVVLSGRAHVPEGQQVATWSSSTARRSWTAPSTAP
jgi:hypothetical protein